MKNLKVVLIAFLIGITAVCIFEYLVLLREKSVLQGNLKRTENELSLLQQEKQNLLQELEKEKQKGSRLQGLQSLYKNNLRAAGRKILASVKLHEEISGRISIFKLENSVLHKRQLRLNQRITQLEQENEDFRSRLSSLDELKKAMRFLRNKARLEGNKGYLLKNGKTTFPPGVNIEVVPYNK